MRRHGAGVFMEVKVRRCFPRSERYKNARRSPCPRVRPCRVPAAKRSTLPVSGRHASGARHFPGPPRPSRLWLYRPSPTAFWRNWKEGAADLVDASKSRVVLVTVGAWVRSPQVRVGWSWQRFLPLDLRYEIYGTGVCVCWTYAHDKLLAAAPD